MGTADTTIQEKLKTLPHLPGCYLMRDAQGEVIYVGKAISLRNRVRSYFQKGQGRSPKVERLVGRIADFEIIVTDTEIEALILECNLIKKHRPYFNVRLRDDKQYPYLKVTIGEEFPRVLVTRKAERDGSRYYGPYTDAGAMHEILTLIRQVFELRSCTLTFTGHEGIRPCLYYHMNQCLAPCSAAVCSKEEYRKAVDEVCLFLEGKQDQIIRRLKQSMETASESLDFERAARIRDRLRAVEKVIEQQKMLTDETTDQDVVALVTDEGNTCVQVFFIRSGKLIGQEHLFLEGAQDEERSESIAQFVKQYYEDAPYVPKEVLLQADIAEREILESWLRQKRGTKVTIATPQRGEKKKLVDLAITNAQTALKQALAKASSERDRAQAAMMELQETLELPTSPGRIEAYDISNLQGTEAVGGMVVFTNGQPQKSAYRRFKIHGLPAQPNDFLMMQQVLRRRLQRALDGDKKFLPLPDLILIDGGKGQLSSAAQVLKELNLALPIVSLAKQFELIYRPNESLPVALPRNGQGQFLLMRIRDEVHRYSITFHRQLRGKQAKASLLDQVEGIGKVRRTALLKHFKSMEAIWAASVEDLARCPGVTRPVAAALYCHLHATEAPAQPEAR